MSNETIEFIRILIYLLGGYGLIMPGVNNKHLSIAFFGVAFQFLFRSFLLCVQIIYPGSYREINNLLATPSAAITMGMVYLNLYKLRRS